VDESISTGENKSVYKKPLALQGPRALGDRGNMVYAGTLVLNGIGKAVVVATGMHTEVGKIAHQLSRLEQQKLPIQKRMDELGHSVVKVCSIAAAVIAGVGLLRGQPLLDMVMTALTLLVAAIPEGLTVMVLISMALGIRRMSGKKVAVRRLPALETLGATTVICCDKTGTLTKNQLKTEVVYIPNKLWKTPKDGTQEWLKCDSSEEHGYLRRFLSLAVLCNSAQESCDKKKYTGDPTDIALLGVGRDMGIYRHEIESKFPVIKHVPFDPDTKKMSVLCQDKEFPLLVVKGAPEVVLEECGYLNHRGTVNGMSILERMRLSKLAENLASQSLRLIAVAYRYCRNGDGEEQELIFAGFIGMRDEIRPEARAAVTKCRRAGVKVVMITGDHSNTARIIAQETGIFQAGDIVLTGTQLDNMSDHSLAAVISRVSVFARTAPIQKLRIVKALQAANHVVAMTGDGVNDAPAIKAADIGIAMGHGGTDVAREAASLVLMDDNFTTIVGAMEEGRNIYFNIRKSVRYLLATNTGEVVSMALAVLLGSQMPLTPAQLLWLNFIGDGLPAIALVSHEPGEGLLDRPPRPPNEDIFAQQLGKKIIRRGILLGVGSFLAYQWGFKRGGINKARTLAMSSLAISQFWHLFDAHSGLEKGVRQKPHNLFLGISALASFSLFIASIYCQKFSRLFQLVPLNLIEWAFLAGISGLVWLADGRGILIPEVTKCQRRILPAGQ
jgi:Ca2+-transporting ATPase